MKSLKRLSILIVSFVLFSAFTLIQTPPYVGKWRGEDKGDIGYVTFTKDGYALFEFDGQIMGGKSFVRDGVEASMHYEVQKKDNFYNMDIIVKKNETDETMGILQGIFKINSETEMVLALGFDGSSRPTDFETNQITLKKVD
ncbi:hypothetical protein ACPX19_08565 [Winogradskyella sp. HB-48]|uniref:hypothetical protein n=1 Tax=Winogradskyella sp. HB-48 TaxID=3416808 RepID=UPI003CF81837